MTYLEAVNRVLRLLREPAVPSLAQGDVVSDIVSEFMNDAKRTVEDAHDWNSLRQEWQVPVVSGATTVEITGAGRLPALTDVYNATTGFKLESKSTGAMRAMRYTGGTGFPAYYAVDGQSAGGDVKLRIHPTADDNYTLDVYGFRKTADLAEDDDTIAVPSKPVVYLAYALAARERGEVGGQTAAEIFGVANQYLRDAIAHDAALNNLDYNWYS